MAQISPDLLKAVQSGTWNVPTDIPGMIQFAQNLINDQGFSSLVGSDRPSQSAQTALQMIQAYNTAASQGDAKTANGYLSNAQYWLKTFGGYDVASDYLSRGQQTISQIQQRIENAQSNISNLGDFSSGKLTNAQQEQILQSPAYQAAQADLNKWSAAADGLGMDLSASGISKDASGNYVPKEWITASSHPANPANSSTQTPAKPGLGSTVKQQADGSYAIVNPDGSVLQGGFKDVTSALAAQTTMVTGAPPAQTDTSGTTTSTSTGSTTDSSNTGSSNPPPGATLISGPSGLQGLTEDQIWRDPNGKDIYKLAPSGSLVGDLSKTVDDKAAAAAAADPTLTADQLAGMRATWLQQAWQEAKDSGVYDEQIKQAEVDMGTSFDNAIADAANTTSGIVNKYGTDLTSLQGNLQKNGMLYGGVRNQQEGNLATATNLSLSDAATKEQQALQGASVTGERSLGSKTASGVQDTYGKTSIAGRVLPGSPTFVQGADQNVMSLEGGDYGSLPRGELTDVEQRANQLESSYENNVVAPAPVS